MPVTKSYLYIIEKMLTYRLYGEKVRKVMRKENLPLDVSIDKDAHIDYIERQAILEQERLVAELTKSFEDTVRRMIDEEYEIRPRKCGHPSWEE